MPRPAECIVCVGGVGVRPKCIEMLQLTHCWHHDDDGKKGTFQVIDDVGFLSTTSRYCPFIVTSLTSCCCCCSQPVKPSSRAHMASADLILRSIFTVGLWAGRLKRNIENQGFSFMCAVNILVLI